MTRTNAVFVFLASVALSTVALPAAGSAGSYSYGYDDKGDRLSWALTSDGSTSMSSLDEKDSFDKLKSEYGDDFLYIRDGEDRYVIRDRGLVDRARDATRPMKEAGREIREVARMRVEKAMGNSHEERDRARLARRIGRLSGRIARLSRDGEDTEDLEREQAELQRRLDDLEKEGRDRGRARPADSDLEARSQKASRRVSQAARHMNQEIRGILRDAKARHLAEPVE